VGIVGGHPESGVRVDMVRPTREGPPWRYEGDATTPGKSFRLTAEVTADGSVSVDLPPEAPPGLADKVRLLTRAAWKHAREDDVPPPRRIVRWRPDG
jgi:hypothetical protein